MIEVKNKDYSISILRVIGMISIVLCHFFGWLKINALAQFLNYGVYLFLFISGYLYANKQIDNYKQWIVTRLKKILIPYYIITIPILCLFYSNNPIDVFELLNYIFCLQGLNFICSFLPFSEISLLGHLWFVTIILICYLLTIIIKHIEKRNNSSEVIIISIMIVVSIYDFVFTIFNLPRIYMGYFITYFIGYYVARYKHSQKHNTFIIFGVFLFLLSIMGRLGCKHFFDASNQNLYIATTYITRPMLAISVYFIVDYLTNKINLLNSLAKTKFWQVLDKYSFFVYLIHYFFLNGATSVDNFGFSKSISILLFIVFTVVSTLLLYWINQLIQKKI